MLIRTPTELGAAIRDRRRGLGLGQAELADKVGVRRQWIIAIEKGKPRAEIGLVLRTLQALDLRLSIGPSGGDRPKSTPRTTRRISIDEIVESAAQRKPRR